MCIARASSISVRDEKDTGEPGVDLVGCCAGANVACRSSSCTHNRQLCSRTFCIHHFIIPGIASCLSAFGGRREERIVGVLGSSSGLGMHMQGTA